MYHTRRLLRHHCAFWNRCHRADTVVLVTPFVVVDAIECIRASSVGIYGLTVNRQGWLSSGETRCVIRKDIELDSCDFERGYTKSHGWNRKLDMFALSSVFSTIGSQRASWLSALWLPSKNSGHNFQEFLVQLATRMIDDCQCQCLCFKQRSSLVAQRTRLCLGPYRRAHAWFVE
jgi:hypothetical protein